MAKPHARPPVSRLWITGALALSAWFLRAQPQAEIISKVEFENDQIRVARVTIPVGYKGVMHTHDAASVEIFITDDHIRETRADGAVHDFKARAGEVLCFGPVTHTVQNMRSAPTELISVEFKGAPVKDCPKADPAAVRRGVEFENDRVQITRTKLGPKQTGPVHTHPEYVGVFLTDAKLRARASDGTVRELEGKRGLIRGLAPVTHSVENLADAPFEALDINLKGVAARKQ